MTRRVRIKSHAKTQRRKERKRRALGIRATTNARVNVTIPESPCRNLPALSSRLSPAPVLSVPLPADRRLRSCLISVPETFPFPAIGVYRKGLHRRGCLTKNPSLSLMSPAGHVQDPFVFYEARISGCGLRVAGCGLRVAGCGFSVSHSAFLTY
jgi:hypothetical protein